MVIGCQRTSEGVLLIFVIALSLANHARSSSFSFWRETYLGYVRGVTIWRVFSRAGGNVEEFCIGICWGFQDMFCFIMRRRDFFFFLRGGFSLLKVKAGMAREAFPCFRPGNRQLAEPLI